MVDEFYLDLVALRELYILLLKTCLPDANSQLLDERAQILLKHLLDDATARVLEFHSKNLATDSWISYNFLHKETARKMVNSEKIEDNSRRDRGSSNIATNDLTNGISSALRRIELHILSLQRFTAQSRNTKGHISETKLAWNEILNQQKVQPRKDHSVSRTRFVEFSTGHNLVGGQKVKPILTSHCSEFVHGFRVPLSQDNDEALKPPIFETHISKQHKLVNLQTSTDKSRLSVGSKATARVGVKLNPTRIQEKRRQNSDGRMVMRPTLLATQQESEFTNTESETASSSSWATQQTNESKTTDDSSSLRHQDSPSVTGSYRSSRYRSGSSSSITSKAFKFGHGRKESKRAIGRLTRLKNKLGLIFHHHHHHHHHNSPNNFMWKQLRKIFHRTDSKRVATSKEDIHGRLKKTAIRNASRKNQVGKFLRHVWRSKTMKMIKKKKDVRVMNSGKKGAKKLQWWKVFRGRRGVKLPSKGRAKIGYGNRKPQVKRI